MNRVADAIVIGSDRAVAGVITAKGRIEAPVVVDAAGAWARRFGDLVGCAIPLWPVRTQLCITDPLAEVDPRHATVRVMNAKAYVRPARGGLMFGAYEPDPLDLDPRERPADFAIRDPPSTSSRCAARWPECARSFPSSRRGCRAAGPSRPTPRRRRPRRDTRPDTTVGEQGTSDFGVFWTTHFGPDRPGDRGPRRLPGRPRSRACHQRHSAPSRRAKPGG